MPRKLIPTTVSYDDISLDSDAEWDDDSEVREVKLSKVSMPSPKRRSGNPEPSENNQKPKPTTTNTYKVTEALTSGGSDEDSEAEDSLKVKKLMQGESVNEKEYDSVLSTKKFKADCVSIRPV